MATNLKRKKILLCESMFVLIDKRTLVLKNGWKKIFSHEMKTSMSFIPMRRMSLWFLIMRRKEIIMWNSVYPNRQTNIDSKKWWQEKFSYETRASMSFIPMRRMSLWCPITKRKEITVWICVCLNWETNINSRNYWKEKYFLWNQSVNVIYPNR